jgi:hypothetical protein
LYEGLHAINSVILWLKANDRSKKALSYARQIGFLDVDLFIVLRENEQVYVHKNELTQGSQGLNRMASGFFANVVTTPNPVTSPLPRSVRRALGVMDLFNQGFFSESFITAFAMLDDTVQRVMEAGLQSKGIIDPNEALRMVKEDRLNHYLNVLAPLCGWKAMKMEVVEVWKALRKTNKLRNVVVHNDREITQSECLDSINAIFGTIGWLQSNPFGVKIWLLKDMRVTNPTFTAFAWEEPTTGESADSAGDAGANAVASSEVSQVDKGNDQDSSSSDADKQL